MSQNDSRVHPESAREGDVLQSMDADQEALEVNEKKAGDMENSDGPNSNATAKTENPDGMKNGEELDEDGNPIKKKKKCNWVGWIIRILVAILLLVAIVLAIIFRNQVAAVFGAFIGFLARYPYVGPLMIILAYIIATVFFLPGLVLTLGSGFALNQAYGSVWIALPVASLSVWIGAEIGSICAFILGRYIIRRPIQKKIM